MCLGITLIVTILNAKLLKQFTESRVRLKYHSKKDVPALEFIKLINKTLQVGCRYLKRYRLVFPNSIPKFTVELMRFKQK